MINISGPQPADEGAPIRTYPEFCVSASSSPQFCYKNDDPEFDDLDEEEGLDDL